jgi:hypothetical protein
LQAAGQAGLNGMQLLDDDVLAAVTDDAADTRAIHKMSIGELKARLRRHNVEWLTSWSAAAATTSNLSQKHYLRKLALDLNDLSMEQHEPPQPQAQAAHTKRPREHESAEPTTQAVQTTPSPPSSAGLGVQRVRQRVSSPTVPIEQPTIVVQPFVTTPPPWHCVSGAHDHAHFQQQMAQHAALHGATPQVQVPTWGWLSAKHGSAPSWSPLPTYAHPPTAPIGGTLVFVPVAEHPHPHPHLTAMSYSLPLPHHHHAAMVYSYVPL